MRERESKSMRIRPRKVYALDVLRSTRTLTMPETLDTNYRENVAAVCRQQFFMSPSDADNVARLAVSIPDLTTNDLDTLDAMLRERN
jgi:hypothetical protein